MELQKQAIIGISSPSEPKRMRLFIIILIILVALFDGFLVWSLFTHGASDRIQTPNEQTNQEQPADESPDDDAPENPNPENPAETTPGETKKVTLGELSVAYDSSKWRAEQGTYNETKQQINFSLLSNRSIVVEFVRVTDEGLGGGCDGSMVSLERLASTEIVGLNVIFLRRVGIAVNLVDFPDGKNTIEVSCEDLISSEWFRANAELPQLLEKMYALYSTSVWDRISVTEQNEILTLMSTLTNK